MTQVSLTQDVCERFPQGSTVTERENLYSKDGVLEVNFTYQTREDDNGKILYCFTNSDGAQSPTLHVHPMKIVALDGVPIGSQEGSGKGKSLTQDRLFIPPAGRTEIIVDGPSSDVKGAQLFAWHVFTGPIGDSDPARPIFNIVTSETGAAAKDYTMVELAAA